MLSETSPLVLVTGSAGRIGQAVVAELIRRGQRVRGFDRHPTPGASDRVVGDLGDFARLLRAVTGVDTVIHLAATPDDDEFESQLVPANVIGLHHVLEAARQGGVRRLMLASTGQVNWWQQREGPWPIRAEDPVTPRLWYAATKVFLEAAGRAYAKSFGLKVLVVRLGWCPRTPEQVAEIAASQLTRDIYLSPGDAGRFFAEAVERPDWPEFAIVFAASQPIEIARFDLARTKALLGWAPAERWPQGTEIITGEPPVSK